MLDPTNIEYLRVVLNPRRERYDFAETMNRWASDVRAHDEDSEPVLPDDGTDWDALGDIRARGRSPVQKTEKAR